MLVGIHFLRWWIFNFINCGRGNTRMTKSVKIEMDAVE